MTSAAAPAAAAAPEPADASAAAAGAVPEANVASAAASVSAPSAAADAHCRIPNGETVALVSIDFCGVQDGMTGYNDSLDDTLSDTDDDDY